MLSNALGDRECREFATDRYNLVKHTTSNAGVGKMRDIVLVFRFSFGGIHKSKIIKNEGFIESSLQWVGFE